MLKLGAVERNVAVCWTMVIAGRYRAATADFTENSRWEDKLLPKAYGRTEREREGGVWEK